MSAAKAKTKQSTYVLSGSWAGAWKVSAGIGGLGLVGALFGMTQDARRFAFSWMFAFCTVLAIALGATFFVLVQRLTSAGWSVTVRRTAEFFAHGLLVMIPLFFPVLMQMGHLFPWLAHHGSGAHDGKGEHQGGHGSLVTLVPEAHAQTAQPAPKPTVTGPVAPSQEGAQMPEKNPTPSVGGTHGEHVDHGAHDHGGHAGHGGVDDPAGLLPGAKAQPPRDLPMHGAPGPHVRGDRARADHAAHAQAHGEIMAKKAGYLNKNFFLARAVFYFLIWALLATRLFDYSTAQDTSKDPKLTLAAQRFSAPGTFLFALTLTFAAFDWIMSLEPSWFSTIFGVFYFACGVVSSLAVLILVTMGLRDSGPLKDAVTVEHFHDLGKLLFGFLVFWGYIGFSQFMLIWYAALPEETTFYHNRWDHGPWDAVSKAIIFGHFVLPFFWLISRTFKRNLGRLQIGAAILLVMHVVDVYWLVMPNYLLGKDGFSFHWMDVACLLAVGGVYAAYVFYMMTKHPLVPIGDPRLPRSLHFQNA